MNIKIKIDSLAYKGSAVGRHDGKAIFVPFGVHGDELQVEVVKEHKSFLEGTITEILRPSYARTKPECQVFMKCGGCHWQNVKYPEQMRWKHRIFTDTIKRIGKIEVESFEPARQSLKPYGYRVKSRFQVKNGKWGFFKKDSNDIIEIDSCPITTEEINNTFTELKNKLSLISKEIKSVEIGLSVDDSKTVASVELRNPVDFNWLETAKEIKGLKGLLVNCKEHEVFTWGDENLVYEVEGVKVSVPVSSFIQSNHGQNQYLVEKIIDLLDLKEGDRVADLFSGSGNFTLPMAKKCAEVIGLDSDESAVKRAGENAQSNFIENARFVRGFAGSGDEGCKAIEKLKPHVIILDPPRDGDKKTSLWASKLGADKIVYISCSPPTLARDLKVICDSGYKAVRGGVVDMFAQTYHIEGFVLLEKIK